MNLFRTLWSMMFPRELTLSEESTSSPDTKLTKSDLIRAYKKLENYKMYMEDATGTANAKAKEIEMVVSLMRVNEPDMELVISLHPTTFDEIVDLVTRDGDSVKFSGCRIAFDGSLDHYGFNVEVATAPVDTSPCSVEPDDDIPF